MELAQTDLLDIIHKCKIDEESAHFYFKQIIDGL